MAGAVVLVVAVVIALPCCPTNWNFCRGPSLLRSSLRICLAWPKIRSSAYQPSSSSANFRKASDSIDCRMVASYHFLSEKRTFRRRPTATCSKLCSSEAIYPKYPFLVRAPHVASPRTASALRASGSTKCIRDFSDRYVAIDNTQFQHPVRLFGTNTRGFWGAVNTRIPVVVSCLGCLG
jgi:hypothetical protein